VTEPLKKPSKDDVSRPREHGYKYKKKFYRSADVAQDYDFHRFGSEQRKKRDVRKWNTILAAIALTDGCESILDVPCGTGRFTGHLARRGHRVVGSDISIEMMGVARDKLGEIEGMHGYTQADAENMPFHDGAFDCVMSIRFMFHLDPAARVRVLREMRRVARRWLIIDYRHRYSLRYAKWKVLRALRLTDKPLERVSTAQLRQEFGDAGLTIRKVIPVARIFSDKWIVLAEAPGN